MFGVSACNRSGARRIAVIPKGTAHVFWQSVHAGAEAAGREFHENMDWEGPPNETDYARQLEIFDSMLNQHVDGIVVAAVRPDDAERFARSGGAREHSRGGFRFGGGLGELRLVRCDQQLRRRGRWGRESWVSCCRERLRWR